MEVTCENRFDIVPETKLWRYMSFAKFMSMLNSQRLLYVPAFRFGDPFEGACGIASEAEVNDKSRRVSTKSNKEREYTFINCWHENDFESEAMWKIYTQSNPEGIAIQTTYERLKNEVERLPFIKIGRVSYVDYSKGLKVPDSLFWYKRKSFEHEKEVRVMSECPPKESIAVFESKHPGKRLTRMVHSISLENLIENVYVSPYADNWFAELVREELQKHHLSIEPIHSALNAKPIYEFSIE